MKEAVSLAKNEDIGTTRIAPVGVSRKGRALEIGTGFSALTFRESDFAGAMDPLVMVDHYRMNEPTFGTHPHAGLSAVSVLFEDSEGELHNRDSLGNDFDLMPGDLYWLKAGSGAVHDEAPRTGAKTHGLQVFVNLPAMMKHSAPESLFVKAQDMPLLENGGHRVRVVLGESNGQKGQVSPALPMTILDGKIAAGSAFSHDLSSGESAWIYAIDGDIQLQVSGTTLRVLAGESIAIEAMRDSTANTVEIFNMSEHQTHFALFAAKPIRETFVHRGPFVMSTQAEIEALEADFAAGRLGSLE